jgi:hypothetical protein
MKKIKDIRKYIKDALKEDFKLDLVLIQIGFMFEAIEEDAVFLSDNCDCQLQGKGKLVSKKYLNIELHRDCFTGKVIRRYLFPGPVFDDYDEEYDTYYYE